MTLNNGIIPIGRYTTFTSIILICQKHHIIMKNDTDRTSEPFIKISVIENTIEAQLVESILTEQNIPHRIRSHHDTAYDGLFQAQKGWGEILAPETCRSEITDIIKRIRKDNN